MTTDSAAATRSRMRTARDSATLSFKRDTEGLRREWWVQSLPGTTRCQDGPWRACPGTRAGFIVASTVGALAPEWNLQQSC